MTSVAKVWDISLRGWSSSIYNDESVESTESKSIIKKSDKVGGFNQFWIIDLCMVCSSGFYWLDWKFPIKTSAPNCNFVAAPSHAKTNNNNNNKKQQQQQQQKQCLRTETDNKQTEQDQKNTLNKKSEQALYAMS